MRQFEVRRRGEDIVFCSQNSLVPPGTVTLATVAEVSEIQTAWANSPFVNELAVMVARQGLAGNRTRCVQIAECMGFADELRDLLRKVMQATLAVVQ